ncbi:MAG: LAGLIDADG family homing endonuclease [archaeon]|nr:LAGLIDADG family homing endonuclease [archaeon]
MQTNFSIFDIQSDWLKDEVYIHGIKQEIKEILVHLGRPTKVAKLIGVSYFRLKEWPVGRSPISLRDLMQLTSFCSPDFQEKIKLKVDSIDIFLSCRYSPRKIKFPKTLSQNLAYCVGLILGDGTLAGNSSNNRGNWFVGLYFDNKTHQLFYDKIIFEEFNVQTKHMLSTEKCFVSYFCSKPIHWFLRSYFGISNGYKASKIEIPKVILNSNNKEIQISFLQGLFDSDGTITKKGIVKYASTSERISLQVYDMLNLLEINSKLSRWIKAEKYLPLYAVEL